MAKGYIPVNRDQQFLLPPDMRDWLPEGHFVWWLLEVLGRLDTKELHKLRRRGAQGRTGYDPDMMLALLVYAYTHKVRSSREVERLCETDIAFKVICGGHAPDHTTIARFRQAHAPLCRQLFAQVLEICAVAGLAQAGVVALDGTRLAANASKDANRTRAQLEAEVAAMFVEAQDADEDEDRRHGPRRGDELPADLARAEGRQARLQAALDKMAEREAQHRRSKQDVWRQRARLTEAKLVAARQAWAEHQAAKKPVGMKPRLPAGKYAASLERRLAHFEAKAAAAAVEEAQAGKPGAQVNLTDPDSRLMTSPNGWVQGYNAQAVINYIGIIMAAEVFTAPNDMGLFQPMAQALAQAGPVTGPVGVVLADAGYCSAANLVAPGPARLISTKQERHTRADRAVAHGPAPQGLSPVDQMRHALRTPEGRSLYKQRSWTVEPGFGNIKRNLGFTSFSRRGLPAVTAEWQFVAAIVNLMKLHRWYPGAVRIA